MRIAVLVVVAGCYGGAPSKPAVIPLPPLSASAELVVTSQTRTEMEAIDRTSTTCPQGKGEGDPACTVTHYTVNEPVTRTYSSAMYGEHAIDYAQFRVLVDPERDRKLARLDELSHDCRRANIPRYAGIALLSGGVIATIAMASHISTTTVVIEYGSIAAGLGSYALGYFAFGGNKCNEARELYDELDLSAARNQTAVVGADRAEEMHELASRFNTAHHQLGAR